MKKSLLVVGLLILSVPSADLLACGEKFLVISRGTRFQRAAPVREPAAILVYVNPASSLPKALERVPVEATLRKVGYRPTTVSAPGELDRALRQGGWDLVIADLSDSAALSARLQGDAAPMILPVAYGQTGAEVAQARKQFPQVLRGPLKSQTFLDAIDDALALRQRLRSRAA
jgi:hypothetical protein